MESSRSRELVDSLRSLGLDRHIELPQIVAMGDTSSGKSSLLSALSGITFPSDKELTTRCPTQLILTDSPTFSGTVRLQRYDNPAEGNPPEVLGKMEDITLAIERITRQLVDEGQSISDDAIVINVKGPNLPNLTLTDLPGIVRSVKDGENPAMIGKVRALINRYMIQERTVILAVHPANVDIHNSEILNNASEADPDGSRTICVITKPDLVDTGSEQAIIDLLNNNVKFLKLGYHMVKCRGQKALNKGKTIADGLESEKMFFQNTSIWSDVEKSLVGIQGLSEKLGIVLQDTIAKSLPSVIKEINEKLKIVNEDIEKMGDSLDSIYAKRLKYTKNSERVLILLQSGFSGKYNAPFFASKSDDNRLRARLRILDENFGNVMRVAGEQHQKYADYTNRTVKIGDVVEINNNPKTEEWKSFLVTSKADAQDNITINGRSYYYIESEVVKTSKIIDVRQWRFKKLHDLTDLKKIIQDNRGNELSIFPSYDIFLAIITPEITSWNEYSENLFQAYEKEIYAFVARLVTHTSSGRTAAYYSQSMSNIFSELSSEMMKTHLINQIEQELRPFTLNHYLHDILMKLRNQDLLKTINGIASENFSKELLIKILESYGIGTASPEEREALEMFWALTAYKKVASKRFMDLIPQIIQHFFIENFLVKAAEKLRGIEDSELEIFLAESPDVINLRQQLLSQRRSLKHSKDHIQKLLAF